MDQRPLKYAPDHQRAPQKLLLTEKFSFSFLASVEGSKLLSFLSYVLPRPRGRGGSESTFERKPGNETAPKMDEKSTKQAQLSHDLRHIHDFNS